MIITDKTGKSISLLDAIDNFVDGVRPSGVNAIELSKVISDAGISNSVNLSLFPQQLSLAIQRGDSVIVNLRLPAGGHFVIVDDLQTIDGVEYYMTRDPYTGPRGVLKSSLDRAVSAGVNAIVIGK
ncbi:hypothetical protein [Achromobacter mucicolens]|nr:hypothetical protein [Achromobacter mucicolens]